MLNTVIILKILFDSQTYTITFMEDSDTTWLPLMASTAFNNHVLIFFQNDVGVVQKVEHRYWCEFCGSAVRLGNFIWVHEMNQGLNNRMVRSVHVSVQGEVTLPAAVERSVAVWSNDPILTNKQKYSLIL